MDVNEEKKPKNRKLLSMVVKEMYSMRKIADWSVIWFDRFLHGLFHIGFIMLFPVLLSLRTSNEISIWLVVLYYSSSALYATYMSIRYGACEYL